MITLKTAKELEKIKKKELTSPDYYEKNIDWLMEMIKFIDFEKYSKNTTGLIEYQKIIKRYFNEKNKLFDAAMKFKIKAKAL